MKEGLIRRHLPFVPLSGLTFGPEDLHMAGRGSRSRARPISSCTARAEDKGWRLTIRTEDGQRLCYRMEIERFALNLDGLQSVQRTACEGAGWTNYVPLTP
jgi:hypothetical protein